MIARCDYWTSPDVIFLGRSLRKRDAEATRAHVRTRPLDTFSRFAILTCASLVPLRLEVGSFELKVYLSLIFGYLGIFFFSVEEPHLSLTICPRHSCGCFMRGYFRRNSSSHCRVTPANTKLRSVARTYCQWQVRLFYWKKKYAETTKIKDKYTMNSNLSTSWSKNQKSAS